MTTVSVASIAEIFFTFTDVTTFSFVLQEKMVFW
jgi:hypothetical protein